MLLSGSILADRDCGYSTVITAPTSGGRTMKQAMEAERNEFREMKEEQDNINGDLETLFTSLEEIQKNEIAQREVKDKIDEYNREARSRYYQLNFWEKSSEGETYS